VRLQLGMLTQSAGLSEPEAELTAVQPR